jgi:hypothetical protein
MASGVFEYTLGAMEGGLIKPDGNVVMTVVTALYPKCLRNVKPRCVGAFFVLF